MAEQLLVEDAGFEVVILGTVSLQLCLQVADIGCGFKGVCLTQTRGHVVKFVNVAQLSSLG